MKKLLFFFEFFSSSSIWKKEAQFKKNRGFRVDMGGEGMDANRFSIINGLVCNMGVYGPPSL